MILQTAITDYDISSFQPVGLWDRLGDRGPWALGGGCNIVSFFFVWQTLACNMAASIYMSMMRNSQLGWANTLVRNMLPTYEYRMKLILYYTQKSLSLCLRHTILLVINHRSIWQTQCQCHVFPRRVGCFPIKRKNIGKPVLAVLFLLQASLYMNR